MKVIIELGITLTLFSFCVVLILFSIVLMRYLLKCKINGLINKTIHSGIFVFSFLSIGFPIFFYVRSVYELFDFISETYVIYMIFQFFIDWFYFYNEFLYVYLVLFSIFIFYIKKINKFHKLIKNTIIYFIIDCHISILFLTITTINNCGSNNNDDLFSCYSFYIYPRPLLNETIREHDKIPAKLFNVMTVNPKMKDFMKFKINDFRKND